VAIVEDWLKTRTEMEETGANRNPEINSTEYKEAMKKLIRDTFLESVINTPNYRDNIEDVVKKVLSDASKEEERSQTGKKK
jgi:hypothetical protein